VSAGVINQNGPAQYFLCPVRPYAAHLQQIALRSKRPLFPPSLQERIGQGRADPGEQGQVHRVSPVQVDTVARPNVPLNIRCRLFLRGIVKKGRTNNERDNERDAITIRSLPFYQGLSPI